MNDTNITKRFPDIPLGTFIGVSIAVCASIGIAANILVLLVLSISARKRFSPYRYLISHLAASDLCCSIFLLVYVPIELRSHNWIYSEPACKVVYPMITFSTNLVVGTILTITIERYRGVVLPHRVAWKSRNVRIALVLVWMIGFAVVIPNILTLKVTYYENIDYCNEIWADKSVQKIYGISFFLCAFFIPLTGIVIMHLQIMFRLKCRDLEPANVNTYQHKMDIRITTVLCSIIVTFFICTLPNKLLYFVWDISPELEMNTTDNTRFYLRTVQILYYARVALDPLLYCFFDTRFRKDFEHSIKRIRGESFTDNDIISRSRSRTLNRSRAPTITEVRSRASTLTNNEYYDNRAYNFEATLASKLSTLQETELKMAASDMHTEDYISDERCRSDSCYTDSSLYGSASPLVRPTYMVGTPEHAAMR